MRRTLSAFAIALALVGTLVASTSSSFAQSRYGTAGAYDRAVNGSLASTPGQD